MKIEKRLFIDADGVIQRFRQGLKAKRMDKKIEKIYLFGSRTKGTERPDSDYDVLIVAPSPNQEFRSNIYDIVVDILLTTGREVSLKIFKTEEFKRLKGMQTPFMQNVLREGIKIG
ncbi:MAG: hypothetical protein A2Y00_06525 [Omnitrophica WOR_2 bacterium GWF2_43_52]|nr:MAG: hypothetical protein A2062_00380 [Omnitrophica WOR_2 bacterium GWA2_44_7]OGX14491.1 MAG: hypothetical protein A2Y01_08150 [Omnitrophica WOR_2 bacterium GWC2_44_8]OGX21259.1 MAG: hypothetical protein A2Y00_06525 [Omnitrophica WOR_2 bacterium GWF2_43_52]OGX56347.1 MAG: hypothetical protein A2460_05225 [Omnitrophica WOR_2 bacterium RIFOXYC2_FULL_43_9]HAH20700.1 nucleotidyltransferase domain-containing protein [Candidatus Omnitrophota bacterium]